MQVFPATESKIGGLHDHIRGCSDGEAEVIFVYVKIVAQIDEEIKRRKMPTPLTDR